MAYLYSWSSWSTGSCSGNTPSKPSASIWSKWIPPRAPGLCKVFGRCYCCHLLWAQSLCDPSKGWTHSGYIQGMYYQNTCYPPPRNISCNPPKEEGFIEQCLPCLIHPQQALWGWQSWWQREWAGSWLNWWSKLYTWHNISQKLTGVPISATTWSLQPHPVACRHI